MAVADNDVLDILRRGTTTALDFHYDQLTAPPIAMIFSQDDIMQLYKIATSVRLAGNAKKRLKMIDDVMKFRGCLKLAGGTNRVVYYHPDVPGVVYKVAIDAIGIKDNPAEFINQNLIKPFCCKVFECDPTGVIASFERLDRITSFLEFYSVADDVYELITKVLIGKYVLADIGTDYFMNFAIRRGFGVCIIDFPYCYELDGAKLICQHVLPNGKVCGGEIDYDEGFNHLICTKCGTEYFARDLAKKGDNSNNKILVVKKGALPNMEVVIRRGDKVIKTIKSNTSVDHLEKINMMKRSDKAMLVAGSGNENARPSVVVRRGNKVVGGTNFNEYHDPRSTENKPFKKVVESQKQNNVTKSVTMPNTNEKPAEKRVEAPKANGNGIPTSALEVILDNFRLVNESLNKINNRIDDLEKKVNDISAAQAKDAVYNEDNAVDVRTKIEEIKDELYKNITDNVAATSDTAVTEIKELIKTLLDANVQIIENQKTYDERNNERFSGVYDLVKNFLDSLDINVTEEEDDDVPAEVASEDVDKSEDTNSSGIEKLEELVEQVTSKEYPDVDIINTTDDHSDLEATEEATPKQEQVTYSSEDPTPMPSMLSKEKISMEDLMKQF